MFTTAEVDKLVDRFITDLKRKSPATRTYYSSIARKFLTECGDFSRQAMSLYITNMGYCDNSVRTTYYVLKRLCRALEKPFPLDTDLIPPMPDEDEIYTPTTSPDTITKLITFWKKYPGDYITALVFLSTIYGLRSIEMTTIEVKPGSFIVIVAKRKGRADKPVMREHIVPAGMDKYLHGYMAMSKRNVEYSFGKACRIIGHKPRKKECWHSVRRALDTMLIDTKFGDDISSESKGLIIKRFMRWTKSRADMPSVYFHKDFQEINKVVLDIHPWLKLWK